MTEKDNIESIARQSAAFGLVTRFCERDRGFAVVDRNEVRRSVSMLIAEEGSSGSKTPTELANVVIGRLRQQEQIKRSRVQCWQRDGEYPQAG